MRILLLLSRIDQTGMTTNAYDLGLGLIEMGHDVHLLTSGSCYENHDAINKLYLKFKNNGFAVHEFIASTKVDRPKSGVYKKVLDCIAILQIVNKIYRIKPDIIHACSPYMSFIPYYLKRKFTTTFHVADLKPCFKFKKTPHLIAISNETKDYAKKYFSYLDEEITIVNNGVDVKYSVLASTEIKRNVKLKYGISTNKIIIGLVGSIEYRKGHDILLKAISNITNIDEVELVFLGSSKSLNTQKWLDDEINLVNLDRIVHKIDYCDPKPIYDIIDIFVLPSRLEGFPLVTIEAMLSGCCVVRSNVEGALEQIDNNISGLLFENENIKELTIAIERLISDEILRSKLAIAGRQKALDNFTHKIMAEKTFAVYNKILESN